jgi:hypothetical protein
MGDLGLTSQGASFAIKRKPLYGSHHKPVQQISASRTCPAELSGKLVPEISPSLIQWPSDGMPLMLHDTAASNIDVFNLPAPPLPPRPTPLRAPQACQQFDEFETNSLLPPKDSLSTQVPVQPILQQYFLPPLSLPIEAPVTGLGHDHANMARAPNPTNIMGQASPPRTPRPAFSLPLTTAASGISAPSPSPPFHSAQSTARRLSAWSKEAADKYWNKETAKKAYKNSKEFLIKTNDKLGKVIDPLMPVLAVANPEVAAAFSQINQAANSNLAAVTINLAGALASQAIMNDSAALQN